VACAWWLTVNLDDSLDANEQFESKQVQFTTTFNTTYFELNDDEQFQPWLTGNVAPDQTNYYRWIVMFYAAMCMLLGENVSFLPILSWKNFQTQIDILICRSKLHASILKSHPQQSSVLTKTQIQVQPVETLEFWVHSFALLFGAILQAYIFGQVALLISDQNSSSGSFCTSPEIKKRPNQTWP
jgi:hypothetical protein